MWRFIGTFYFSLRGRTSRKMYWLFGLLCPFILGFILGVVLAIIRPTITNAQALLFQILFVPLATWVWSAIGSRRLHDIGLSGWWMILVLGVPIAIAIADYLPYAQLANVFGILALGVVPGTKGPNRFGADPKADPPMFRLSNEPAADVPK